MIDLRMHTILFCQRVVLAYGEGRINQLLKELDKIHNAHGEYRFSYWGICFLLHVAGPEGSSDLFRDFLEETGRDGLFPVDGEAEFVDNVNLWADVEGREQQSNHSARIDLLREFIDWLGCNDG